MIEREEIARDAIRDSWDRWLSQRPVSLPDLVAESVKAAVREWMDEHADEMAAAIAESVLTNKD